MVLLQYNNMYTGSTLSFLWRKTFTLHLTSFPQESLEGKPIYTTKYTVVFLVLDIHMYLLKEIDLLHIFQCIVFDADE